MLRRAAADSAAIASRTRYNRRFGMGGAANQAPERPANSRGAVRVSMSIWR